MPMIKCLACWLGLHVCVCRCVAVTTCFSAWPVVRAIIVYMCVCVCVCVHAHVVIAGWGLGGGGGVSKAESTLSTYTCNDTTRVFMWN